MERNLVLCARSYSFTDKDSGKLVEGASLSYLTGDVESLSLIHISEPTRPY